MEERNPYRCLLDPRQLMAGTGTRRTCFPATPPTHPQAPEEPFILSGMLGCHHQDLAAVEVLPHGGDGGLLAEFGGRNINTTTTLVTPAPVGTSSAASTTDQFGFGFGFGFGLEMNNAGTSPGGGDGHGGNMNSRWPRQETLTLLEIRSRLDSKFKDTNQKGPLWDYVSRIMWEEHGYQRSGRKCREKFENLYKYYKKTKEGKAGTGRRQDGKHYRFFHQFEALCEEPSHEFTSDSEINHAKHNLYYQTTTNFSTLGQENQEALHDYHHHQSNSSEFETSSSINTDNDDLSAIALMLRNKELNDGLCLRSVRKSLKNEVDECLDSSMMKLIDTQEAWMEKMLKRIEQKEEERMIREEKWRTEEAAWVDQEHKFWANQRARVEARDTAVMEALQRYTKIHDRDKKMEDDYITEIPNNTNTSTGWIEVPEVSSFIHLRTSMEMEPSFHGSGYSKECLWEEISAKMACLGYDWSVIRCKETWENMSFYFNKTMEECDKKGIEYSRTWNS